MPVNTVKQLDFNAEGGTVFAKQVDKQNLYALLNVFFRPVDTKNLRSQVTPHPIVGMAISKRPLDRVLIGGALGLTKVQVFAALLLNRVQSPQTLTEGSAATNAQLSTDLRFRYERKFQAGINVPVRQVVDYLKKK